MQYLLDLETLLLFLGRRKQSGELTAHLKRFPALSYKGPCNAHILVVEGKVAWCAVKDPGGRTLIDGEHALDGLKKLGQMDWSWASKEQANVHMPPVEASPAPGATLIPRRAVPLEMINKNALTRWPRQILLLVDGSRSVIDIATLLLPSPSRADIQEVMRILHVLQQQGIIIM